MNYSFEYERRCRGKNGEERPEWQKQRGERYGNRRKEISRLKWKDRRRNKHKEKFQAFFETDFYEN